MSAQIEQLKEWMAQLVDLRSATHLLEWDQQTMMPARGAGSRAETLATIHRVSHERFVSAQTGELIEAAAAALNGASPDSDEARMVDVTRRRWEKSRRVPIDLAADLARAASIGQEAWIKARATSDFAAFEPYLDRNLELARRYVDCFDDYDCAYDVLLDDFEPGMKTDEVSALFAELRAELVPMIATLVSNADRVNDSVLYGSFPVARQRQLVTEIVQRMGFDPAGWRIDDAVHPFATSFGSSDVRITTRWDESYFASAMYGAMHECGHGLYEAGIAPWLQRTPLGQVESLSLHESQSRLWENMVGRGRSFSGVLAPRLADLFGQALAGLDPGDLFRAVNSVKPSFIRVEADEATYGLHVVVRFELEQELIEGQLAVADLPEAWDARFKEYLGLDVPDDAHGVLQDVHWSMGAIGYFPTYQLGNLIAGQLWERAHVDIPDLEDQLAVGNLHGLREWLRVNIHSHGSKFTTGEILARVVGGPIEVGPYLRYLKEKLGAVYGLEL
jgi:carboxypeptidase Taq